MERDAAKRCYKCGQTKQPGCFSRDRREQDGRKRGCKECDRRYREQNKQQIAARAELYYAAHKEELNKKAVQWAREHKEHVADLRRARDSDRRYYKQNREAVSQKHKQYYQENRERVLDYAKNYREDNKQRILDWMKGYYQDTREVRLYMRFRCALMKKYRLTVEQFEAMRVRQSSACAICGFVPGESEERLCVDHCHKSGKVRSLLCRKCNTALGMVGDDPQLLLKMVEYLRSHSSG